MEIKTLTFEEMPGRDSRMWRKGSIASELGAAVRELAPGTAMFVPEPDRKMRARMQMTAHGMAHRNNFCVVTRSMAEGLYIGRPPE